MSHEKPMRQRIVLEFSRVHFCFSSLSSASRPSTVQPASSCRPRHNTPLFPRCCCRWVRLRALLGILCQKKLKTISDRLCLLLADIEQRVGSQVWIILRGEKEFTGTLVSYDEFISTKTGHPKNSLFPATLLTLRLPSV